MNSEAMVIALQSTSFCSRHGPAMLKTKDKPDCAIKRSSMSLQQEVAYAYVEWLHDTRVRLLLRVAPAEALSVQSLRLPNGDMTVGQVRQRCSVEPSLVREELVLHEKTQSGKGEACSELSQPGSSWTDTQHLCHKSVGTYEVKGRESPRHSQHSQ